MSYRIHPAASRELDAAAAWYESQREGLGAAFLEAYAARLGMVLERPQTGAPVPVAGGLVVRKFRLKRFPYTIFAVQRSGGVVVVAVAHQKRRPGYWKARLRDEEE